MSIALTILAGLATDICRKRGWGGGSIATRSSSFATNCFKKAEITNGMYDKFNDECGVFGIFGHEEAANLTRRGRWIIVNFEPLS